jgi:hypothetical protein
VNLWLWLIWLLCAIWYFHFNSYAYWLAIQLYHLFIHIYSLVSFIFYMQTMLNAWKQAKFCHFLKTLKHKNSKRELVATLTLYAFLTLGSFNVLSACFFSLCKFTFLLCFWSWNGLHKCCLRRINSISKIVAHCVVISIDFAVASRSIPTSKFSK